MVKAFTPWGVEVNFYTLWCNGQHCKEYPSKGFDFCVLFAFCFIQFKSAQQAAIFHTSMKFQVTKEFLPKYVSTKDIVDYVCLFRGFYVSNMSLINIKGMFIVMIMDKV